MSNKQIRRRTFLKVGGWSSLVYWLTPVQKALSFSAVRMRRSRSSSGGRIQASQALLMALAMSNAKMFRSSQAVQSVLGKTDGQTLKSSQAVQSVLVRDSSQAMKSSQAILIVLAPT